MLSQINSRQLLFDLLQSNIPKASIAALLRGVWGISGAFGRF